MRSTCSSRPASASSRSRTSRAPATWPTAIRRVTGRPGVCIAQNGPGITNFVTADRRRLLGALAGGGDHARRPAPTRRGSAASRRPSSCRSSSRRSPSTRSTVSRHRPHRRADQRAASTTRCSSAARPSSTSRATILRRGRRRDPAADPRSSAAPAGRRAWTRPPSCSPRRKFPVILSRRRHRDVGRRATRRCALAEHLAGARSSPPTCTTTPSRRAIRSGAGPIGYQGSKAAMKLLAQADVVLALGTPARARSAPCPSTASTIGRRTRSSSRSTPTRASSAW